MKCRRSVIVTLAVKGCGFSHVGGTVRELVHVVCILCIPTLLGLAGCSFFVDKLTHKQTKICAVLKLFYNLSVMLKQTCSFKTTITI